MRNILKINDSTTVQLVKSGSFRYVQQVCEEGVGIRFENVFSSYIEAEAFYMSGAITEVSEGDVLYYYQTRDVDDSFAPLGYEQQFLIGVFTVEKCIRGRDTYTFVAYDNIHKLNTDFSAKLLSMKSSFPMTLQDFCDEFTSFVSGLGVTIFMSSYWAYHNLQENHQLNYFYANGITALDILSYLVSLTLQQVVCYPTGQIGFRWYLTESYQQTSVWKNTDQYIIAPTDQTTYAGTYIDPDTGDPVTGTLIPVFYKEGGLSREGYSLANLDGWYLYGIDGSLIYGIEHESPSTNAYNITDNIFASKLEMLDDVYTAWDEISDQGVINLYNYVLHDFSITPFEVHLFPFRCPFMAGQIIPHIIDADGNQFQSVVMKMEWTDSEVVLTCVAPEYYYQSSSKNFDADDVNKSLSVAINDLENNKVSKSGDTITGDLSITGNLNLSNALPISGGGTGKTSSDDALAALGALDFKTRGIAFTSGTNIDTDLDFGITYYSASSSTTSTLNGTLPITGSGFKLIQFRSYSAVQSYYTIQLAFLSNGRIKTRHRDSSNVWSAWVYFLDGSNLPLSIANGGTGATTAEGAADNLGVLKTRSINNGNAITTSVKRKLSFSGIVIATLRVFGNSAARCGEYAVYGSTSGIVVEPIKAASACSITTGTGYFQIASTSGSLYADLLTASPLSRISETAGT